MVKADWLWVLTRVPNAIGSAAHSAMKDIVFKVINDKLDEFDPDTRLRATQQTEAEGCVYSEYPLGWENII